jgi:hypothetical protein
MIRSHRTAAAPYRPTVPLPAPSAEDPILSDLRAFAREIGLSGTGAMSKDELVESLRQRYVLQTLICGQAPSTAGTA